MFHTLVFSSVWPRWSFTDRRQMTGGRGQRLTRAGFIAAYDDEEQSEREENEMRALTELSFKSGESGNTLLAGGSSDSLSLLR